MRPWNLTVRKFGDYRIVRDLGERLTAKGGFRLTKVMFGGARLVRRRFTRSFSEEDICESSHLA
jgi:hypothetical protein